MNKLVVIESPFSGNDVIKIFQKIKNKDELSLLKNEIELENSKYLKQCIKHSLRKNEAPYASHGFFTYVLDDDITEERDLGIQAGFMWGEKADHIAIYCDRTYELINKYNISGFSIGIKLGIVKALLNKKSFDFRYIHKNDIKLTQNIYITKKDISSLNILEKGSIDNIVKLEKYFTQIDSVIKQGNIPNIIIH